MQGLNVSIPELNETVTVTAGDIRKDDKARISRLADSSNADSRRAVGLALISYPAYTEADFSWASGLIAKVKRKAKGSDLLFWDSFSTAFDGRFRKLIDSPDVNRP